METEYDTMEMITLKISRSLSDRWRCVTNGVACRIAASED